ncbi:MAG: c-type cytochrome biogenesis protein CcsB [Aquificaceae bacterium]|nr:c-type cytochrome biogenesis protein CcsB [Aquificaceae bacterium]MDW8433327.1 c-type cytochrome biogenesis protein CcsB [Aquificaceae bacterium]
MKEVYVESSADRYYRFLPWVFLVVSGFTLGLLKVDNTFWYKSATLAYALSSLVYISTLLLRDRMVNIIASLSLGLGLVLNLAGMVRRTIQTYELGVPHPPWSNLFEALTFWSFVVGFIYLFLERKYGIRLIGAVVVPLVFGLSAFAIFYASKDIVPLMPALRSYWLYVHVVTAFVGYAGFTVGFGGAVFYLIKERFPQLPLPSREVLDEITYKSIVLVFPLWTASIILGAAWANEAWGGYWSWDPKEVWSLIVWLFFGAYLHARQMLGWKGKRTAWMVVFGFIAVLICFFAVNLFFPGMHSYATD